MTAAGLPLVSVVVPVLNGEATIERCLASIFNGSYPESRREIVVVDNGSTDRTRELVGRHPVRLLVELRPGLSHARNHGIEESGGGVVAFTDSDCYVSTDWLAELTSGLGEDGAAAVTADVVPYPPSTPAERYAARRKPSVAGWQQGLPAPWFCFMNTAVRREAFERVGLFDPSFAGVGCEDIDFAWRFSDAGLELRRLRSPVVLHHQRTTAAGLFHQQVRNGRGWALLHRRYPHLAAWNWRRELGAWADLGRSAVHTAGAQLRTSARPGAEMERELARYDLLLKLGQRIGFLHGRWRSARRGNRGED